MNHLTVVVAGNDRFGGGQDGVAVLHYVVRRQPSQALPKVHGTSREVQSQANLASGERHRGVLAFVQERYEVALDYFSRAFERQRSAGNLSNVLATLIRLGDISEARDLLSQVRGALPQPLVRDLERIIAADPDLALLRTEVST